MRRCYYCGWPCRTRDEGGRFLRERPARRIVCHAHADLPRLDPYFKVSLPRDLEGRGR